MKLPDQYEGVNRNALSGSRHGLRGVCGTHPSQNLRHVAFRLDDADTFLDCWASKGFDDYGMYYCSCILKPDGNHIKCDIEASVLEDGWVLKVVSL